MTKNERLEQLVGRRIFVEIDPTRGVAPDHRRTYSAKLLNTGKTLVDFGEPYQSVSFDELQGIVGNIRIGNNLPTVLSNLAYYKDRSNLFIPIPYETLGLKLHEVHADLKHLISGQISMAKIQEEVELDEIRLGSLGMRSLEERKVEKEKEGNGDL